MEQESKIIQILMRVFSAGYVQKTNKHSYNLYIHTYHRRDFPSMYPNHICPVVSNTKKQKGFVFKKKMELKIAFSVFLRSLTMIFSPSCSGSSFFSSSSCVITYGKSRV
jgi:hypothetical protein